MSRTVARVCVPLLFLPLLVAGCSIFDSGEDSEPTATVAAKTDASATATSEDVAVASVTMAPTTAPTTAPTPSATPTTAPTATATPSPTPTLTPTPEPTATATPIPIAENPFLNVPSPDVVLENYTVTYTGVFETPQDGQQTLEIFIEQSGPNRYHLRAGPEVEIWVIDTATYFKNPDDGAIFLIPSAVDPGLVSPAAYLIQVPNPANVPQALVIGQESIDGRPATHYRATADQVQQLGLADDQTMIDPEGVFDIWIDAELGYISQMLIDVEWTDENGERQASDIDLIITRVGSTPEVVAPI